MIDRFLELLPEIRSVATKHTVDVLLRIIPIHAAQMQQCQDVCSVYRDLLKPFKDFSLAVQASKVPTLGLAGVFLLPILMELPENLLERASSDGRLQEQVKLMMFDRLNYHYQVHHMQLLWLGVFLDPLRQSKMAEMGLDYPAGNGASAVDLPEWVDGAKDILKQRLEAIIHRDGLVQPGSARPATSKGSYDSESGDDEGQSDIQASNVIAEYVSCAKHYRRQVITDQKERVGKYLEKVQGEDDETFAARKKAEVYRNVELMKGHELMFYSKLSGAFVGAVQFVEVALSFVAI